MPALKSETNDSLTPSSGSEPVALPGFRTYPGEVRRIGQLIRNGEFRTGIYRGQSMLINVWNFQVRTDPNRAECPCCGWQGPAFITLSNWRAVETQSRCPRCGSSSRHRGLTRLLPELLGEKPPVPALIFAPEARLLEQVNKLAGGRVSTTDYLREDVDFPGEDIQHLSFADNSFGFLMCNHVLEHIPDDTQALLECGRILRPDGFAVFSLPGDFSVQATWVFDKPDSNGHYRHYGLDVVQKMRQAFKQVDVIDMSAGRDPRWHIRRGDMAFVCRK